MPDKVKATIRFLAIFFTWLLFGFIASAEICIVLSLLPPNDAEEKNSRRYKRIGIYHISVHIIGLIILLGGGSLVVNGTGGYVKCSNNITMDRYCMFQQNGAYLFPYIGHYFGGGYLIANWFLDGCHLFSWSTSIPTRKLYVFGYIPFESKYHLLSKFGLNLIYFITWLSFVDWSTEPDLSKQNQPSKVFVSLGGLLFIFLIETFVYALILTFILHVLHSRKNQSSSEVSMEKLSTGSTTAEVQDPIPNQDIEMEQMHESK